MYKYKKSKFKKKECLFKTKKKKKIYTWIAGVGVKMPIPKLRKFVKDVIVIDGPKKKKVD